jgi:hypothetical protein
MKSKRKIQNVISKTGVEVTTCYCRKCMKEKKPTDFFPAVDEFLDSNGFMSICRQCCDEIYENNYRAEKNFAKAILKTCRTINLKFNEKAVEAARSHLKTAEGNGRSAEKVIGIYKGKLITFEKKNFADKNVPLDLTFQEDVGFVIPPEDRIEDHESQKTVDEMKQFWGENFEYDEYIWLENKYAKWKIEYSIKTSGEAELLQMIILKLFDIRKAREEGKSTDKLEIAFQNLLKTSGLTPAQTTAASQGKTVDTWGMLIKMVEKEHPAEHYKDYKLFADFFDLGKYLLNYVTRPITNFFTGQKNYDVDDNDPVFSMESNFDFSDEE